MNTLKIGKEENLCVGWNVHSGQFYLEHLVLNNLKILRTYLEISLELRGTVMIIYFAILHNGVPVQERLTEPTVKLRLSTIHYTGT